MLVSFNGTNGAGPHGGLVLGNLRSKRRGADSISQHLQPADSLEVAGVVRHHRQLGGKLLLTPVGGLPARILLSGGQEIEGLIAHRRVTGA